MQFGSDNIAPAHPAIMDAVARANEGDLPSYGTDQLTKRVQQRFSEVFERDVAVFFVPTGTAANALAISHFAGPGSLVLCHRAAHAYIDECGATEFFSGGAKMLPLAGESGKLTALAMNDGLGGLSDRMPARIVTLTQATECGAVYAVREVASLTEAARKRGLKVHMDGARFANAVAALGVSPADITWRAGVDVMSFGGAKNGCLGAEAVVFFDAPDADGFDDRRRRAGAVISKARFVSAQFSAYLADNLWLTLAAHANAMAKMLADGLERLPGARLWHRREANEIFVSLPQETEERLGLASHRWITPGDGANGRMLRFVCSWATTPAEVEAFLEAALRR
ncbi:MAG: low specificity L-threonine aldolase [Parvularculaceae bacterium]